MKQAKKTNHSLTLKILLVLSLAVMPFLLTSCYGKNEPSNFSHVMVIGIDKGENDNYTFSFLSPAESGGEKSLTQSNSLLTVSATSLGQAESIANYYSNRQINITHVYLILFSQEIASDSLEPLITSMVNYNKIRPLVSIGITDGKAFDYIKGLDETITQSLPDFFQIFENNNTRSFATLEPIHRIYPQFHNPISAMAVPMFLNDKRTEESQQEPEPTPSPFLDSMQLPMTQLSESQQSEKSQDALNSPLTFGTAIVKNFKLVDILTGNETLFYNMIANRPPFYFVNIDSVMQNDDFSVYIKKHKDPKIELDISGDHPVITIELQCDNRVTTKANTSHDRVHEIIETAEKMLEHDITDFLYKTAQQYNADIFNFYRLLHTKFLTLEELNAYDWDKKYPLCEFKVNVEIYTTNLTHPERAIPTVGQ